MLDRAALALEHELPDHVVVSSLLHGPTRSALVRSARDARLVVLRRRPPGWRRVVTLSVTNGVAAHAHAPVVVVPADWRPDPGREATVVVGVDDLLTSPQLLSVALDQAAARGARLRIVHAWHYSDQYDDVVFADDAARIRSDGLRRDLERELHPTLIAHPAARVDLIVRHAHPADLLVAESRDAGLLVVGRHRPAGSLGPHLGSVVRAVLREASCPVLVADAAPVRRAREDAGADVPVTT